MNDKDIPILNSLMSYARENNAYFHMPGHKGGNVFKKLGLDVFDYNLLSMDVTEIPGVDNLHCPEEAIKVAQEMAADAFGADMTFFLVNGTTAGIYAMIMAATTPGDKIIIPRNCHKAVTGAVILGRLSPVYINPDTDNRLNIASAISSVSVDEAVRLNPDAKAIVITNPTFYGACSDLEAIAHIAHDHGMLLLVDEAHGAHFSFHPKLPKSALQCGADMVAQSTHKTLPAMTQSSMLHVKSSRVDIDKLRVFLQLTQSTSPSHILLASLDMARYIMQQKGEELLGDVISWCNLLRQEIYGIEGIYSLSKEDIGRDSIFDIDSTRITINMKDLGLSGIEADHMLRQKFKVQVEMADLYNIVAICSVGDSEKSIAQLREAVKSIATDKSLTRSYSKTKMPSIYCSNIPEMSLLPWEAVYRPKEAVLAEQSIGRICGEMIVPYPPGIPIIMPGEVISKEILDFAIQCRDTGIKLNGVKDASLKYVTVIK